MIDEFLKIPKERVAVLIGKGGSTKKKIEQLTHTKIEVDSEEGNVNIRSGKPNTEEVRKAQEIVKAVGRGFSPENALSLLDDAYYLEIIDLKEMFGKSEKEIMHKKGRAIGKDGKVRDNIEDMTETKISVYGKTISIIGAEEGLGKAKHAIEMLLQGSKPQAAYNYLKRISAYESFDM